MQLIGNSKDLLASLSQYQQINFIPYFGVLISYFFAEVNQDTLLQFLELFFRRFQSYQHKIDVRRYYFTVSHDITMNFSITIKTILQELIKPIIRSPLKFSEITVGSINFSFEMLLMLVIHSLANEGYYDVSRFYFSNQSIYSSADYMYVLENGELQYKTG